MARNPDQGKTPVPISPLEGCAVVLVAALFILLAPLGFSSSGYLFEEGFPYTNILPTSLAPVGERIEDGGLAASHEVPAEGEVALVTGDWWPRLSLVVGDQVLPLLTESYQAAWPYWLVRWLPGVPPDLARMRRVGAFFGALSLLLLFLLVRRRVGRLESWLAIGFAGANSMVMAVCGSGYLYEAWQLGGLVGVAWTGLRVRDQATPARLLLLGLVAGLTASMKLTAGPGVVVLALLTAGWRNMLRPAALWSALGFAVPLLPFLVQEGALLAGGRPSALWGSLGQGKGNLAHPERIPEALVQGLLWMTALPFGNEPFHSALIQNRLVNPWLLPLSAAAGGVVFGWAWWRVLRGPREPLLTAIVVAQAATLVVAALLYATGLDFQAFMPFHMLSALLLARFVTAVTAWLVRRGRKRTLAAVCVAAPLAILVVLHTGLSWSRLEDPASPLSRRAQDAVVPLPAAGDTVITTAYNEVGLFAFRRPGEIREINIDRALSVGETTAAYRDHARAVFRQVLAHHPAAWILLDREPVLFDEGREPLAHETGQDSRKLVYEACVAAARDLNIRVEPVVEGELVLLRQVR